MYGAPKRACRADGRVWGSGRHRQGLRGCVVVMSRWAPGVPMGRGPPPRPPAQGFPPGMPPPHHQGMHMPPGVGMPRGMPPGTAPGRGMLATPPPPHGGMPPGYQVPRGMPPGYAAPRPPQVQAPMPPPAPAQPAAAAVSQPADAARNAPSGGGETIDAELRQRVEKVARFVASKPQFEETLRAKERNNPRFAFLFGGVGSTLFAQKLAESRASGVTAEGSSEDTIGRLIKRVTTVRAVLCRAVLCGSGSVSRHRRRLTLDTVVVVYAGCGGG